MAAPGTSAADKRHIHFMKTLYRLSDELTDKETAEFKTYCMHLIPKGGLEKLPRAIDVFLKLIELVKIDQENLDLVEEILEAMGRQDLIKNVLRPFQRPDREIPENPDLTPGTSDGSENVDGTTTSNDSNLYLVVLGQVRMIQETLDRLKNNLASLAGTRKSKVKFRGCKKHRSILVHFTIPRENTAVLRLMADLSDIRLVYMGVKSLQIDAEPPIEITREEAPLYDVKRQLPADDIEVGCSTRRKQQRAPKNWTRLSALNLFSDALPLHLQVAESLEYQGYSYSLVRALAQRDQLREDQMRQIVENLRTTEVDSNSMREKAEVDSDNTIMTLRSRLNITDNQLKEARETIAVLEEKVQQAQEYAEKVIKQVTSHVTAYKGEKATGEADWKHEKVEETKGMISYGGSGSDGSKFRIPRGVRVVMSPSNEIFVVDKGNRRVQVHNSDGVYLRDFPTVVLGTEKKAMTPHDVSIDANGKLWVVGEGKTADYVVQYSKDGSATASFKLPRMLYVRAIAVDKRNNHILLTEPAGDRGGVQVIRPDGSRVARFGHPDMRVPDYITVDGEGNTLVSDWFTGSVYMYDESGKFLRTEVRR